MACQYSEHHNTYNIYVPSVMLAAAAVDNGTTDFKNSCFNRSSAVGLLFTSLLNEKNAVNQI